MEEIKKLDYNDQLEQGGTNKNMKAKLSSILGENMKARLYIKDRPFTILKASSIPFPNYEIALWIDYEIQIHACTLDINPNFLIYVLIQW